MKNLKVGLIALFLFLSTFVLTGCPQTTEEDATKVLKQLMGFQEVVFYFTANEDLESSDSKTLEIKKIRSKELKAANANLNVTHAAIYRTTDNQLYLAFLDNGNPPGVILNHKIGPSEDWCR